MDLKSEEQNTNWKASNKKISDEEREQVRKEIQRQKQEGVPVNEIKKRFNISKPQLYRLLLDPTIKKKGRKTKIGLDQRADLLKKLLTTTNNSFPKKKKVVVNFLKEMENQNEIPNITNHVKYPEYKRFKDLYQDQLDQQEKKQCNDTQYQDNIFYLTMKTHQKFRQREINYINGQSMEANDNKSEDGDQEIIVDSENLLNQETSLFKNYFDDQDSMQIQISDDNYQLESNEQQ